MAKKKPAGKPRFPLYLHRTGQWAKKVRGKLHYFGTDKNAALARWVEVQDDLLAGRTPRPRTGGLTVKDLCNHFLTAKRQQVDAGELGARMWADYYKVCESVVEELGATSTVEGLRPDDFAGYRAKLANRLGPVSLGIFVQRVRTIFKYGFDCELLTVPVRFGPGFKKPSRRVARLQRAGQPLKLIPAADIWTLLGGASEPLAAMILLGINCGFGQADCADLTRSALGLRAGWIDFPRPKTGIGRRAKLWPETVAALDRATDVRPAPAAPADDRLVFITRFGRPWIRFSDRGPDKPGVRTDSISLEFGKLCDRVGVAVVGKFYTLRHTFRTVADAAKDPVAVGLVMGHDDDSMAGNYRQSIGDDRLEAVAEHVRAWLLAGKPTG